jgi:hypothetical protein
LILFELHRTSRATIAADLCGQGFEVAEEDVLTPAALTLAYGIEVPLIAAFAH